MGNKKVVVERGTGPGGSVGSNAGIRRGGGSGKYGGRIRGTSRKLNRGIN